jgi:hypothetical protein
MKKIKQKTTEQLHEEIMNLFIGQEMSTTLEALIQTTVGVAEHMEVDRFDFMRLIMAELELYEEMENAKNVI